MISKRIIGAIASCIIGTGVAMADPVGFYTVGVLSNDPGGTAQLNNANSNWALKPGGSGLTTATFSTEYGTNTLAVFGMTSAGVNGGFPTVTRLGQAFYDLNEISGLAVTASVGQTPEPGNLALLGSGLLILAGVLRRKFS